MSDEDNKKPSIFGNTPSQPAENPVSPPPVSEQVKPEASIVVTPTASESETPIAAEPQDLEHSPADNALDMDDLDDFSDLDDLNDLDDLDPIEGEFDDDLETVSSTSDDLDLSDDDFSDFDDDLENDNSTIETSSDKPKKQGFIMKNFNAIVIGGGALLAVVIFWFQFMGGAPQRPMPLQSGLPEEIAQQTQIETELPQPSPISPSAPPPPASRGPLTPMPALQTEQTTQLPNLDISAEPVELEVASLDNDPLSEPGMDVLDILPQPTPLGMENTPDTEPSLQDALSLNEPAPLAPEPDLNLLDEEDPAALADLPAPIAFEEIIEPTPQVEIIADIPAIEPEPVSESTPVPSIIEETNIPTLPELEPVPEEKTAQTAPELDNKMQAANDRIAELTSMLSRMENKIEELEQGPIAAPPAVVTSQSAKQAPSLLDLETEKSLEAPVPTRRPKTVPIMKQPVLKSKSVGSVPAKSPLRLSTNTVTRQWILRSAQLGRAVVSDQKTGDLRTIETGDKLPGIGKILSIAPQNGRWVVRGSKGRISQ